MNLNLIIDKNLEGTKLYKILNTNLKLSKRLITKLKNNNLILCNNEPQYTNYIVKGNDVISVNIDFEENSNDNIVPISDNINIIYEDDSMLVVNKPPNMPTHPSCNHYLDTLSNIVKNYYIENNIHKIIRPINRLDKDTSGIVIFAKNQYVQEELILQMKNGLFKKNYIAIVEGFFDKKMNIINKPISRESNSIIKRCINDNGEIAITEYTVLKEIIKNKINLSLVSIILKTGRTHQIRVHMSSINHPILGDSLYGNESTLINRQALHCNRISFIHPISNQNINFEAPVPEDIQRLQL